jgi:hypothetical protein
MVRICWDFERNQPRHFPAGTYNEQVARPFGKMELDLMELLHRCWSVFSLRDLEEWTDSDQKFVDWVAKEPKLADVDFDEIIKQKWQ